MSVRHFPRPSPLLRAALATAVLLSGPTAVADVAQDAENVENQKPFQRYQWHFEQRADPLGWVPPGALIAAKEATAAHMARAPRPTEGLITSNWISIGAAPVNGGQIGTTIPTRPMSGRVTDIAIDPTDNDHWLIAAAQGGIWETSDAGATWAARTDDASSLAMGSIAFAPGDATMVYAGTGEAAFSADAYAGGGILKSTDGGTTWTLISTTDFVGNSVSDVKVSPSDPDLVIAGTTTGIAGRVGAFNPAAPLRGVYRTTNGGTSWTRELDGDVTDIEVDAASFLNQYAGVGNPTPTGTNGVFRSTDGGDSWSLIAGPWDSLTGGIGRIELAWAPSDSNTLYVSIQDGFNSVGSDGGLLGLWKTTNALDTTPSFVAISTAPTGSTGYCGFDAAFASISNQCWYSHEIIVDPADANTLYAGGVPLWKFNGTTWSEVSKTVADPVNGIHVDQHAMAWAGSRLVAGNDGGVWSSTDGGSTWADHNTNLSISQYYEGSLHPDPDSIDFYFAGAQDNGTHQRLAPGVEWDVFAGGDGMDNLISLADPDNDWAISFQVLQIFRTNDAGLNFANASATIDRSGAPFVGRFEACPGNGDVVLAGTNNLWRSTNFFQAGLSFSSNGPEMSQGLSAIAFASTDATCATYAFGVRASASIGVNLGALRFTSNSGGAWVDWDSSSQIPNRAITDIAFDPADGNVAYVTISGFNGATADQVWKSTNALSGATATWTNVSPPVDLPANSVVIDPTDSQTIYVGNDQGVWYSTNGGTSWSHWGPTDGMPNVAVFELQMSPDGERLVAFTHGRGAFLKTNVIFIDGFETGDTSGWTTTVP